MIGSDFKLLIFDLDGVLVDSSPAHARAFSDLWQLIGIAGPAYPEIAGRGTREVVAEYTLTFHPSVDQLKEWVRLKQLRAREYLAKNCVLYDDTVPSLQRLARKSHRMALGTGASRETAGWILKELDLARYFSEIITAEDVQSGKPDPEIYERLMEIIAAKPEETLIIEDSLSGLQAASASQAYFASVRSGIKMDTKKFAGTFVTLEEMIEKLGLDR